MAAKYAEVISRETRAEAIRTGMLLALASSGADCEKLAAGKSWAGLPAGIARLMIATSVLAGVPLGAMAHHAGRKVKGQSVEEKERMQRIMNYNLAQDTGGAL